MLISHKWLKTYLPELDKYSTKDIAESLTVSLAEVEQIIPVRQELKNIFVGEVIELKKHENSDKLSICTVTTNGDDRLQIVCGADNVVEKAKVAVCMSGGKVYTDKNGTVIDINTTTIRGVESNGMICSERELGLGDDHRGILILEENIELGSDLSELLSDWVYEIENKSLSHRGDCFSHKGIAREISAILAIEYLEDNNNLDTLIPSQVDKKLNIEISVNNDLCKRFSALLIDNIEIKPSPLWLKSRLSSVGERSINNVVDITNFSMLDQGQPLHAYNYDKLTENRLIVRKAKNNEEVTTLDGTVRTLDNTMVVIADAKSVEDIAGIMGGINSQVTPETKTILLEAANFNMYNIRKTSRQLGLRSEASTRFEKGIDESMTVPSLKSTFTLVSDLAGGELAADIFDYYPDPVINKKIEIELNSINRFLMTNFTKYEIIDILKRLHIEVEEQEGSDGSEPNFETQTLLTFKIPTYRKDLNIKEDLIEEVARIYGFKNITPKLPEKDLSPAKSYLPSVLFRKITQSLVSLGYTEVKTYSFTGETDINKTKLSLGDHLKLSNPIAPEMKYIRNSLIPGLLNTIKKNQPKYTDSKIFEISRLVEKKLDKNDIHIQPWYLSIAINHPESETNPFKVIKGITENIAQMLNIKFQYSPGNSKSKYSEMFHPYRSATITLNNEHAGVIGTIHPEVLFNHEIQGEVSILELKLDDIIPLVNNTKPYKPLASYPETTRDLSFWMPAKLIYSDIESTINKLELPILKRFVLKDTYIDEENKKSITITFTFGSDNMTLTDVEVDKVESFIKNQLESKLELKFRSH